MPSKHILKSNNTGFTLLELLMVVTIMAAIAWMSLGAVNNNMDQVRFDDTRNRLESIKRAIIGDSSRTINGQPEIRGYVANMGNLPPSLQALIVQDYCPDPQYTDEATCNTTLGANSWVKQGRHCSDYTITQESACMPPNEWEKGYSFDTTLNLWTGWNGPYLTAKELIGYAKFRDGWGNKSTTPTSDFGWKVTSSDDFTIQSYGKEGDSSGTDNYEVDYPPIGGSYPPLVKENEYKVTVTTEEYAATLGDGKGSITVDFGTPEPCWGCWDTSSTAYISTTTHPPGVFNRKDCEVTPGRFWRPKLGVNDEGTCIGDVDNLAPWVRFDGVWLQTSPIESEKICLKIAYREKGALKPLISVHSTLGTTPQDPNPLAESTFTWDGSRQQLHFVFPDDKKLPMGVLAYNVFEYDETAGACTTTKFQPENKSWSTFTIVPGTSTTPLNWKLQ